ncbi:NADP-dependent malic enzyme [Streptomyces hirsutus]|uniref:NAD(P)-dependent malic enzyme n=1 Tax=Streptomyces hirsutus TaxID=35620 RepID=UPI003678495A
MKARPVRPGGVAVEDSSVFAAHAGGKLSISTALPLQDSRDLSVAYTPGVAQVSLAISRDPRLGSHYTWAGRLVAVVTDGTAVLGLGNVGPSAALPVMEGKAALFQRLANINAIPLALATTDPGEIVEVLTRLRPSFGAVCLEDIAAPRCFELEARLVAALDCPVMHDDQHGTAVAVLAGLQGACTVTGRRLGSCRVVVLGAGAAGVATAQLLLAAEIEDVTVLDSQGILTPDRSDMNAAKTDLAARTNPRGLRGGLAEALRDADILVGLSSSSVPPHMVATMAPKPIVFALSNPVPEIWPEQVSQYGAIVATGGSNHSNQIINLLASPGIFSGALDAAAVAITHRMKLAAAAAIARVAEDRLAVDQIVPHCLDPRVAPAVAQAVIDATG